MEIRPLGPDDLEQAWQLDKESFHAADGDRSLFLEWQDPARFVGAFDGGRLVALSGVHEFGQFFGGRAVSMGGLTSVSVAPHRRGEGLGPQVVQRCLEATRERGRAISALFPATTRVYRRLGWELAGAAVWRTVEPRALAGLPRPEGVTVRPAEDADDPARRACYRRMAQGINGSLDRSEHWWEGGRRALAGHTTFVVEDEEGELAGYLTYRQLDGEHSAIGGDFQLACRDFVWTRWEAGVALLRLLGSWATQVERIFLRGGPEDPLLLVLPEQPFRPLAELRWMSRIVDVSAAIAERGFPSGLAVDVSFELSDPLLPANTGTWTLRVEQGKGRLAPGGSGALRLGIGALSSLYTGWASTSELARAGLLHGGSDGDRAALDSAFGGPTPWMLDEF
jgi:predicted acetyltransferase